MIKEENFKESLPKNWEKLFINRPEYDPQGYRVWILPSKDPKKLSTAVVYSEWTNQFMDYYFEDKPEDEWIDMTPYLKKLKPEFSWDHREYKITNTLLIKADKGKVVDYKGRKATKADRYPRLTFKTTNPGDKKRLSFAIHLHRLFATIFIPNPSPNTYTLVNHINQDRNCYDFTNLEWCSPSYNVLPENRFMSKRQSVVYRMKNVNTGEIEFELSGYKEVTEKGFNWDKLRKGRVDNGYTMERVDLYVEDYLTRHPFKDDVWHKNKFITTHKVEANKNGVLRVNGKLTVGSRSSDKSGAEEKEYYYINLNGKRYSAHRIIYETISGEKIPDGYVIDHIIPITRADVNNEFSNLRVCTVSENMNNPITKLNLSKSLSQGFMVFDLFGRLVGEYHTAAEFVDEHPECIQEGSTREIAIEHVKTNIVGINLSTYGFLFSRKDNYEERIKTRLNCIFYKYDSSGKCVDAGIHLRDIVDESYKEKSSYISRKYLNTGMKYVDGYYYWQGQDFQIDDTNVKYVKKKKTSYIQDSFPESRKPKKP